MALAPAPMGRPDKDRWDKAGVIGQYVAAILVAASLCATAWQISGASRALEASTIYGLEKDFSDRFTHLSDDRFKACFGQRPPPSPEFGRDDICLDTEARVGFLDLLAFYRLLLDLQEKHALDAGYVDFRLRAACDVLASYGSAATIADFARKQMIQDRLVERISRVCGPPR